MLHAVAVGGGFCAALLAFYLFWRVYSKRWLIVWLCGLYSLSIFFSQWTALQILKLDYGAAFYIVSAWAGGILIGIEWARSLRSIYPRQQDSGEDRNHGMIER